METHFPFFYNKPCKKEKRWERMEKMALLEVKNVKKIYTTRFGNNQVEALKNVNFSVESGEYVAIMGESGSGKTTLLNILAALDKPTEGKVYLKGNDLGNLKEKDIAAFRRQNMGFVFQDFNLLDTFSLKDNIYLPLVLSGAKYNTMEKRLAPIAEKLGITQILDKYPYEVSGGQTILMVTHSVKAASSANRILFIKDGEVFHQIYRGNLTSEQLYQKIADTLTVLTTGGVEGE